mgnify:FL=1
MAKKQVDYKSLYEKELILQFEHMIIINHIYNGVDKFTWFDREKLLRHKMDQAGMTKEKIEQLEDEILASMEEEGIDY